MPQRKSGVAAAPHGYAAKRHGKPGAEELIKEELAASEPPAGPESEEAAGGQAKDAGAIGGKGRRGRPRKADVEAGKAEAKKAEGGEAEEEEEEEEDADYEPAPEDRAGEAEDQKEEFTAEPGAEAQPVKDEMEGKSAEGTEASRGEKRPAQPAEGEGEGAKRGKGGRGRPTKAETEARKAQGGKAEGGQAGGEEEEEEEEEDDDEERDEDFEPKTEDLAGVAADRKEELTTDAAGEAQAAKEEMQGGAQGGEGEGGGGGKGQGKGGKAKGGSGTQNGGQRASGRKAGAGGKRGEAAAYLEEEQGMAEEEEGGGGGGAGGRVGGGGEHAGVEPEGKGEERAGGEKQAKGGEGKEQEGGDAEDEGEGGGGYETETDYSDVESINDVLVQPLVEMRDLYKSGAAPGNRREQAFKAKMYSLAVDGIRRHKGEVKSAEHAQGIKHVGPAIADHVREILDNVAKGEKPTFTKLEEAKRDPEVRTKKLFASIWGVGGAHAQRLYDAGFRSLDDLKRGHPAPAGLNHMQHVGLEYFDELGQPVPREEAAEIGQVVAREVQSVLGQDATVELVGGFRRGEAASENVDCLVRHPTGGYGTGDVLGGVVDRLREVGLITHVLQEGAGGKGKGVPADDVKDSTQTFSGLCRLRPGMPHRRLMIRVYPPACYPFALLYYTGDGLFSRNLRTYAHRPGVGGKMHRLTNRGLFPRVSGGGVSGGVGSGEDEAKFSPTSVQCETEDDVFRALGLKYVPPNERSGQKAYELPQVIR
eukprot:jgi/Mesvir1/13917/Mv16039-RA.1